MSENPSPGQALLEVADRIQRGEWSPRLIRLVDRTILGGRAKGSRIPGPLLQRYNQLARECGRDYNRELETLGG